MTTHITPTRIYARAEGSTLVSALTTSWDDGDDFAVENVADFDPGGGSFCIVNHDRSTVEEGTYEGINEDTDELTGVVRPDPDNWPADSIVESGADGEANVDLFCEGYEDIESNRVLDVPIRSNLWPLFKHLLGPIAPENRFIVEASLDEANNVEEVISGPSPTTGIEPQLDGGSVAPGTIDAPAMIVGTIRIVETEADLADLEAKEGDAAYVRGFTSLYKYMNTQPVVTTYDTDGDPVSTPVPGVLGDPDDTPNWYRTSDAADILADSITATHLQVATLSAITANLGTVTLGTGGYLRTAVPTEGETRIEITDANKDRIRWVKVVAGSDVVKAQIELDGNDVVFMVDDNFTLFPGGDLNLGAVGNVNVNAGGDITLDTAGNLTVTADNLSVTGAGAVTAAGKLQGNRVVFGTDSTSPGAGFHAIYKDGKNLRAKDEDGNIITLGTFP